MTSGDPPGSRGGPPHYLSSDAGIHEHIMWCQEGDDNDDLGKGNFQGGSSRRDDESATGSKSIPTPPLAGSHGLLYVYGGEVMPGQNEEGVGPFAMEGKVQK